MDEDEGRALLAAYLPAGEPPEPPVTGVVTRARTVRRRRRTVLASGVAVVAVLAASSLALGSGRSAAPPSGPASGPALPTLLPDSASRIASPPKSPAQDSCQQANRSNDPGAKAWASWVRGKLAGRRPQAGSAEWIRMCAIDFGHGLAYPPHIMNSAIFALPLSGGVSGTDSLTAATDRWDRLPALYRTPCRDDVITEHVKCEQRRLPDGSLLVQRDFFDILIQGDPDDPAAKRDKQAVRDATRIFADGRTVSIGLVYNLAPAWKRSFDRHVLSLDQLAAIVTDPGALRYFPRP